MKVHTLQSRSNIGSENLKESIDTGIFLLISNEEIIESKEL